VQDGFEWDINHGPQIVPGLKPNSVRGIAAGASHCAALNAAGTLYTWS
jgi:alpha-tubulin suppressor-like RCC1 family protein